MTDEGVPGSKEQTSAATKSHRLATALATLGARVVALQMDDGLSLEDAATLALAGDPTLRHTLGALLQKGSRGPAPAVDHPCARLFYLVQGLPDTLHNDSPTLHKVSQVRTEAARVASSPPPPPPPPPDPPSPVAPSTALTTTRGTLRPSDGTLRSAQGVEGGRRDPHFEALADALYPGLDGEYAGMDDRARGQCARALQQIKRAEDKRGVPDWQQPERIKRAVANWPNVKGSEPITPTKVAGNWTALTAGIQVGGRDNGTVRHHHQYLNESATVKHPSRMGLE